LYNEKNQMLSHAIHTYLLTVGRRNSAAKGNGQILSRLRKTDRKQKNFGYERPKNERMLLPFHSRFERDVLMFAIFVIKQNA
jgi:hypothetical protein